MASTRLAISVHIFILMFILHCQDVEHGGVWAQNSIKPRKSKINGNYRESERLRQLLLWKESTYCPELLPNRDFSDCLHPCRSSRDCRDKGQICCSTLYASDCEAECKTPVYIPKTNKNKYNKDFKCIDLETGAAYKLGEFFPGKNDTCCKCTMRNEIQCVDKPCSTLHKGCFYNRTHYNEGMVVNKKDKCNNCTCSNSSIICTSHSCSSTEKCVYKGQEFREGQGLYLNNCKHCNCLKGYWVCREVSCSVALESRQMESGASLLQSVQLPTLFFSLILPCWSPG